MSAISPGLASLGWDSDFENRFRRIAEAGDIPARVVADYGTELLVHDGTALSRATTGRRYRDSEVPAPAVGDWVALRRRAASDLIAAIVDRRTAISRKVPYIDARQQMLAANVDIVFVVAAATDVNSRRVERCLVIAWQSGASPIVVLTKADVAEAPDELLRQLESVSLGTPVLVTSAVSGQGLDEIRGRLQPARTAVLLGPSGAGKSTLINRITGMELMKTRDIHRSGEGRHMTSHRQLVQLPEGGMIIDTPGLREAQLWEGEEALGDVFEDIERLILECRFPDCSHQSEPGCAVKAAVAQGSLDATRLQSYRKLQRELRSLAARSDARLRADERRKWKQIAMANRAKGRYLR
ncbi:MAG: ribosome small subunit-dependent GTPase A [Candidatus Dormibacterales bacterium]